MDLEDIHEYQGKKLPRCIVGKICYTKKLAETVRNKRTEKRYTKGSKKTSHLSFDKYLRIYPCNRCNSWHLTHMKDELRNVRLEK